MRHFPEPRNPSLPDLIIRVYDRKVKLDDVFDSITYDTDFSKAWEAFGIHGVAYGNLHLINHHPGYVFVVTHAHLASVRDMTSAWFDTIMYSLLVRTKYPVHDLYDEVVQCLMLATNYANKQPVDIYDLIKMWPSLCIGTILRDVERYAVFYDALIVDVPHTEHAFVRRITRAVTGDSQVHLRLELCGLGKIFGHPVIDMERSITTWLDKGTVMKPGKQDMGRRCSEMLKLVLCRRFHEERNRWPPLVFNREEVAHIRDNYRRGVWMESPTRPWMSWDFAGVRFQQTFEFNMYVDPSDLLSDKSLIPSRRHWVYEYDSQAHRTLYGTFLSRPLFES